MFTIQKILSGGGGGLRVLKTLFYFFTEGSADLGFEARGPTSPRGCQ